MRYLIFSDIHSNWEALQAMLAATAPLGQPQYDRMLCCGDLVGYGANPNEVVDWVRANLIVAIRGNHDRACSGMEDLAWFNPVARASALWTREQLSQENLNWLRKLPPGPACVGEIELVHGSPRDEDEYLLEVDEARGAFGYVESDLVFFGHSHLQGGFAQCSQRVQILPGVPMGYTENALQLDPDWSFLINPGSVGQPRDGDPRAAWAIYDDESRVVFYQRAVYDVASAQRKILDGGLPEVLAVRLGVGK